MREHRYRRTRFACASAYAVAIFAPASAGSTGTDAAENALFARYAVSKIYRGPIHFPDFGNRDRAFSLYRTAIRRGMRAGANFAGHYAILNWGCGTQCIAYVIADVATGRVFDFPLGGENAELSLDTRPTSRLIVASWISDANNHSENGEPLFDCHQDFIWNGTSAVPLSKPALIATAKSTSLNARDKQ